MQEDLIKRDAVEQDVLRKGYEIITKGERIVIVNELL